MSNLPHPLGSSVAGQLFYPGAPHVTAYDVPGSHGSRAVEFGEDGTSAATNRLGYALAKNDEYQQARLEAPIAKPTYVYWTPTGGSGAYYTFAGVNLFVGDATYLPETQDIRDSLICVLDSNWNEILDVYGNRVVVKSIKNAGETSSIVGDQPSGGGDGNGFYSSGAVIRFKSVNPVDGTEFLPTVDIPDGTNVILVFGKAGTLDTLATVGSEHLMRDMLVKGVIRSSAHNPAASFLRDGSRTMLANINMDGHQVVSCQAIRGTGGSPLEINNRVGGMERVMFSDKWLSYVSLSNAGCTAPYTPGGFWPSIVGVLNSGARMNEGMNGNRVLSLGGVIDWQLGYMNFPEMVVSLNGEAIKIAAQRFPAVGTVSSGDMYYAVINGYGIMAERFNEDVEPTDVILACYDYSGSAWNGKVDARWNTNGSSATFEVTCAPATYKGADFTSLQTACDFVSALCWQMPTGRFVIRVLGVLELPDTLDVSTYAWPINVTIKGDNPFSSKIVSSGSFSGSKHLFNINGASGSGRRISFEDLSIVWLSSNAQADGYAAIYNPGDRSHIKNCAFHGWYQSYRNVVLYGSSSPAPNGMLIQKCWFGKVSRSLVDCNLNGTGIVVEDCVAEICSSDDYAFRLNSADNKVVRTQLKGDGTYHFDHFVKAGQRTEVSGCYAYLGGGSGVNVNNPLGTGTGKVLITAHDNYFENAGYGLAVYNTAGSHDCQISFRNNMVYGGTYGAYIYNNSTHTGTIDISGNRFSGQTSAGIWCADYGRELQIRGNQFSDQAGNVIKLDDNYNAHIIGNTVHGYGSGGVNYILGLNGTSGRAWVRGNDFDATGASSYSTMCYINVRDVEFSGNKLWGYTGSQNVAGLVIASQLAHGGTYVGNRFYQATEYLLQFYNNTLSDVGRCTVSGNMFGYVPVAGAQLKIHGFNHVTVTGNVFGREDGGSVGGNGVLITKTLYASTFITVTGNTFRHVEGRGYSINGVIVNDDMANWNCNISNNTLDHCGFTDSGADWSYGITTRGFYSTVNGNVICQMKGPADGAYGTCCICLVWGNTTVSGNQIYQNVADSTHTYGTFVGIWGADHYCTVTGNGLQISGTISASGRTVYGIKMNSGFHWHTITGNNIGYWANALGTNYAIHCPCDGCTVVANRSGHRSGSWYGQPITCTGGSYGMVLGNVGGNIYPGGNATSGNQANGI